jgi:hypothetical protein
MAVTIMVTPDEDAGPDAQAILPNGLGTSIRSSSGQGRKRLRERECGSQDERMAFGLILNEIRKSKMEIPDYDDDANARICSVTARARSGVWRRPVRSI